MTEADLSALARACGVATSYRDWAGRAVPVPAPAVVAVLGALGVPAGSPEEVAASLRARRQRAARLLPPAVVLRDGRGSVLPRGVGKRRLTAVLELEDGSTRPLRPDAGGVLRLEDVPLGWHRLAAAVSGPAAETESAAATVISAPARVPAPQDRCWGWMAQLYALRGTHSWGLGDYSVLRRLVAASAADGAGVLLVNPLHAETPVAPLQPSPYSPSSRRVRSPLYLCLEEVPEYRDAPAAVRAAVDALRPPDHPPDRRDRLDRDRTWAAKVAALELLWPFHRRGALASWRRDQPRAVEDFAAFCALAERHGRDWRDWPPELRAGPVAGGDRAEFHLWLQLLVDEQVRAVGEAAATMPVGVVHDLAVGVDPAGADAWALQDVLALGAAAGAPPDSFNQRGQDWGLPPWHPDHLADAGYAPFRDVVRAVLRDAGGLRIDHVMGLFRLWWVPAGRGAAEGSYVSYDADALLAVLALEAHRAGAVVVGEDLGTVEDRVRAGLSDHGVLGSAVLWCELDSPAPWGPATMASITTHDLPTAAGFLAGEGVRVRHELGQLTASVEAETARFDEERSRLTALLAPYLDRCGGDPVLALHALLAASPSVLVLAALGDAVGDLRQPNLPGTVAEYPNWCLPLADGTGRPLALEDWLDHPGTRRLVALLAEGVR